MTLKCVLVVGGGGREHALGKRLLRSESVAEVIFCPGNAGTAKLSVAGKTARNVHGDPLDVAVQHSADLVVVGPEAPLVDGLADRLAERGVAAYGPSAAAAQLEASKAFMKDFAKRHDIPSADYRVVDSEADAISAIDAFADAPVVKADGLCGGKGVVVAQTHAEAKRAAREMLVDGRFGAAGKRLVIEQCILGHEASVHAICDGERYVLLPVAQDHKRIGDGDRGPNTGGMGTYAPADVLPDQLVRRVRRRIIEPILSGMRAEGTPFVGTLFAGLMVTEQGDPSLLEINVRFGDPETQVIAELVDGDFADLLMRASQGNLPEAIELARGYRVCVVLAADGYPAAPRKGDAIEGLAAAENLSGVDIYHAGTTASDGALVTSGGRVLGVTGAGATLAEARRIAYEAADLIRFEGKQMRRDIAGRDDG